MSSNLLTLKCQSSSIMKKSISIILLATILLQSCVAYQKTSVSLNEAYDRGKVEVINNVGKSTRFTNIILKDSIYYGINSANRFVEEPLDSLNISAIYLQDIKESRINTWIGVSLSVILIGLIIWGVSTMTFDIY